MFPPILSQLAKKMLATSKEMEASLFSLALYPIQHGGWCWEVIRLQEIKCNRGHIIFARSKLGQMSDAPGSPGRS
jgi:hypothetical protein